VNYKGFREDIPIDETEEVMKTVGMILKSRRRRIRVSSSLDHSRADAPATSIADHVACSFSLLTMSRSIVILTKWWEVFLFG
jgi:hypothetical protein